jgi:hypothetical protein
MELTRTYETDEHYYLALPASGVGSKNLHKSLACVILKEGIFSNTEIVSILRTCQVVYTFFSLKKQLMIFSNYFCKTRNYKLSTTTREEKNITMM